MQKIHFSDPFLVRRAFPCNSVGEVVVRRVQYRRSGNFHIVNFGSFVSATRQNGDNFCRCVIINVGKKLILGLPQKQTGHPIGYSTLLLVIYHLKCGVQRLWRFIYGLITMSMLIGALMGIKDPGKVQNWRVAKSRIVLLLLIIIISILILVKKFIPRPLIHGCKYCSINNTNKLRLLMNMCFWVKKESTGGQISSTNNNIQGWTSVFLSLPPLPPHTDEWIASFYIAFFNSRKYGNYIHVHTHFMPCWN